MESEPSNALLDEMDRAIADLLTSSIQELLRSALSLVDWLEDENIGLEKVEARLEAIHASCDSHDLPVPRAELQRLIADRSARILANLDAANRLRELLIVVSFRPDYNYAFVAASIKTEMAALPEIPLLRLSKDWTVVEKWADIYKSKWFRSRWDFCAALLLDPRAVEDFLDLQEHNFLLDVDRYGTRQAKVLYGRRALSSIWPQVKWAIHRLMALEVIRRFFH